jgi:hypothetical protein
LGSLVAGSGINPLGDVLHVDAFNYLRFSFAQIVLSALGGLGSSRY